MDCESSNKGSYAWKSIIQAKHVIEVGRVWRVGNGQSIQVRNDRWLPQVSGSKVISPLSGLGNVSKVCDLINHDKHGWKVKLINNNFMPHEAKIMKGIPFSVYESQDKEVWLPSKHGEYTTQSAYKLLARKEKKLMPSCS